MAPARPKLALGPAASRLQESQLKTGPRRKKNLQRGRCLNEMLDPGFLIVSPETWSKSINISELGNQGRERTGTQMASYPIVPLVNGQVLISRWEQGSDSQALQCPDIYQPGLHAERGHLASSWAWFSLRLGFFIYAGTEGQKPVTTAQTVP